MTRPNTVSKTTRFTLNTVIAIFSLPQCRIAYLYIVFMDTVGHNGIHEPQANARTSPRPKRHAGSAMGHDSERRIGSAGMKHGKWRAQEDSNL